MKIYTITTCISAFAFVITFGCIKKEPASIVDLSGTWSVQLDPEEKGIKENWFEKELSQTIQLPGTTDEAGLGKPEKYDDPYNALIRPHYYVGKAWYQREIEIPPAWDQKNFTLLLERCHWITQVWVNSQYAGTENSLCTPQEYDLTSYLKPGKNRLTICVDNEYPFSLGKFASSVSEHTQSNWNGMVGSILLKVRDPVYLDDLRVYPDVKRKEIRVGAKVLNKTEATLEASIRLKVNLAENGKEAASSDLHLKLNPEVNTFEVTVPMGDGVQLWDEFSPSLYRITASLNTKEYSDQISAEFGMREVGVKDKIFTINGKRTYLRGNLECCVFPLTGYPSMNVDGWMKIMKQMKEHGFNHVRFHSWCPPEAAFEAADGMGIYIQAEAPRANVKPEKVRDEFIKEELFRINRAYGNHPSFILMTGGNELLEEEHDDDRNSKIIAEAIKDDNRHLYSTSSGGIGADHIEIRAKVDQYRVGGIRGFKGPGTMEDHGEYYGGLQFASITHEIGQWASYPCVNEIPKYTGVLRPVNLMAVRDDLKEKGMLDLAQVFTDATTRHAAILYKEEIEVLLRSQYNPGFQLLALHDYPGQGTAHVGLFDSFWDNKGGITKQSFRKFCSPVTPLLRMEKRTYDAGEIFIAQAELLNYGPSTLENTNAVWTLSDQNQQILKQGTFNVNEFPQGERVLLGEIRTGLSFIKSASKLTVSIKIEGTEYLNDWEIWCYPNEEAIEWPDDIVICPTFNPKAETALNDGRKVLILPTEDNLVKSLPGNPKSVFWSPIWPWTRPRGGNETMSILCDPGHPVFEEFPTEYHSNWQWWSLQEMSNSIMLDTLQRDITPIVRVIDNYSRNHKLGNLIEANVGNGKLMICSIDIESALGGRPEARQLRNSIIRYMQSEKFIPRQELEMAELEKLFK